MERSVPAPGCQGRCEPVAIQALVNDALAIDAELVCGRNGRKTIDGDRGAGVDVEDLGLAVEGFKTVLIVVLDVMGYKRNSGEDTR